MKIVLVALKLDALGIATDSVDSRRLRHRDSARGAEQARSRASAHYLLALSGGTAVQPIAPCALWLNTCADGHRAQSREGGTQPWSRVCFRRFSALGSSCIVAAPARAADDIEAKAQTCAACHGQNGVPIEPKTIPIIWGQQQSYLMKQLRDYRNGERDNPIMTPIAKGLAQDELRKIAAYFAAKSWPAQATRRRFRVAAERHRPVPAMPSAEFRGRPAGAAAGGAQLRVPGRIDARLRRRSTDQQRRHAEIHAGADRQRAGRDGALSFRAVMIGCYSITSSASASSVGGMARPIARAVLRLMIRSNLVGCNTGRSAGFAPLRMRPT